jgi:hypothetical protein
MLPAKPCSKAKSHVIGGCTESADDAKPVVVLIGWIGAHGVFAPMDFMMFPGLASEGEKRCE